MKESLVPASEKPRVPMGWESQADREKNQKEEAERHERLAFFDAQRNKLIEKHTTESEIATLRSLVERGLISPETLAHAVEEGVLSPEEIQELFLQIEEIEQVERIEDILPMGLRVSRDEYLRAIEDHSFRPTVLDKINHAIGHVTKRAQWKNAFDRSMGGFLLLLSKSLRTIQENLIDLKRWLNKADTEEGKSSKSSR